MTRGDSAIAAILAVLLFVRWAKRIDKAPTGASPAEWPEGDLSLSEAAAGREEAA